MPRVRFSTWFVFFACSLFAGLVVTPPALELPFVSVRETTLIVGVLGVIGGVFFAILRGQEKHRATLITWLAVLVAAGILAIRTLDQHFSGDNLFSLASLAFICGQVALAHSGVWLAYLLTKPRAPRSFN